MSNNESDGIDRLAAAFAALSNPQRLRMFVKLAKSCCATADGEVGPGARFCCATEVGSGLDVAPSTVSHHLKELRQAGLVHVERHGRRIDCWASQETLERLVAFFAAYGASRRRKKTSCASPNRSGTRGEAR